MIRVVFGGPSGEVLLDYYEIVKNRHDTRGREPNDQDTPDLMRRISLDSAVAFAEWANKQADCPIG